SSKLAADPGVDATAATSTAKVTTSAKRFKTATTSRLRVAILASARGRRASAPLALTKRSDECADTPCYLSSSRRANLSGTKPSCDGLNKRPLCGRAKRADARSPQTSRPRRHCGSPPRTPDGSVRSREEGARTLRRARGRSAVRRTTPAQGRWCVRHED